MKFLFSFLFSIILLSPALALQCTGLNENDCITTNGCGWNGAGCVLCLSGEYNDGTFNECRSCENSDDFIAIQADEHKTHPNGASSCSEWECISGYGRSGGNCVEIITCELTQGQKLKYNATTCDDWICEIDFYKTGDTCTPCPTGAYTPDENSTNVRQCICNYDTNLLFNSDTSTYLCGTCRNHSEYNATNLDCECNVYGADPETCDCPSGSYYDEMTNACKCNGGTAPRGVLDERNVLNCVPCATHASFVNNECQCNIGYYGSGETSCQQCPAGMITPTYGAISQSSCRFDRSTKFCDENGENCMRFLQ